VETHRYKGAEEGQLGKLRVDQNDDQDQNLQAKNFIKASFDIKAIQVENQNNNNIYKYFKGYI